MGAPPEVKKCVIVAAPHTALADGFWMLMFAWWWGLRISWLVKRSAVRGPFGWFLRRMGAIPVDRSAPQGLVGELAAEFASRDELLLSIPPEGTRARREYWKSGFYHIALSAKVPICLSYLDYARRTGGFGPCFPLTGNYRADMDRIRAFYQEISGKHPARFTHPRLREESQDSEQSSKTTARPDPQVVRPHSQ